MAQSIILHRSGHFGEYLSICDYLICCWESFERYQHGLGNMFSAVYLHGITKQKGKQRPDQSALNYKPQGFLYIN